MTPAEALPIGVCSWSLQVQSVPQLVDFAQKLGIRHVQLACGDPVHASWIEGDRLPETVRETNLILTGAMLAFRGEDYATPQAIKNTGGFGPASLRQERLQCLQWGLNRTKELGLQDLSFHAGFIPPVDAIDRTPFLNTLARAGEMASEAGIVIGFETGQESAELLKLTLEELGNPNLKVNFDPANMLLYDMGDPVQAVELLAHHIRRVHVKDAIRPKQKGEWGQEMPLGQGDVDMAAFIATLWRVGYRGPLCIEREVGTQQQRLQDIADGVVRLRQFIGDLR